MKRQEAVQHLIKDSDWLKKVEQYGPIMLAKSKEGKLVYIIYDKEF